MTKWLVGLLLGIYLAFQLGGDDPAKLRPGLVNAGVDPETIRAMVEPVETRTLVSVDNDEAPKVVEPERILLPPVAAAPKPAATKVDVVSAAYDPDDGTAPTQRQPDKVFTLSVLPGQENAPIVAEPMPEAASAAQDGQVWYVTGRSVNVRLDPSTDAPIVGKLSRGEAALVLADNGDGWARITVEGDGVSGYVSMDFLSPEAP